MKILHITPHYEPAFWMGGVTRAVSDVCAALVSQGHDVTVWTADRAQGRRIAAATHDPVRVRGVEVHYLPSYADRITLTPHILARLPTLRRFDIVHLSSFWHFPGVPVGLWSTRLGPPTVSSPHGTFPCLFERSWRNLKHTLYYRAVERPILRHVDALHFTSERERAEAAPLGLKARSFLVPNAVDAETFADLPGRRESRSALGLAPDALVLFFLGRIDRVKALDLLIAAAARARRDLPGLILALAGPDFGDGHALRAQIARLQAESWVSFLGMIDQSQRRQWFAAADGLALVSHHENFGLAAAEAMAAGLPVLVSRHTGIAADIAAYDAGLVVEVDTEAITAGLLRLFATDAARRARVDAAKRLVRERYSHDAVGATMAQAYADILSGGAHPRCSWSSP